MNILVVNLLRLGDFIISTPIFKLLKQYYPQATISVLTRPPLTEICQYIPQIDNMFVYKSKFSLWKYIKIFKRYDCVIYIMENQPLRLKFFSFLKIPIRIGYLLPNINQKDLTDVVSWNEEFKGLERLFLKLLEPLEIRQVDAKPELVLSPRDLQRYKNILPSGHFKIAIHTDSYAPSRRWPYFNKLIKLILTETEADIILTGTKQGKKQLLELNQIFSPRILDLRGKTCLKELPALFKTVDLVIGNDTGALHIARAVGTKTIIIFGPEDPQIISDFSNTIKIYPSDIGCKKDNTFFNIAFPNVKRCKQWKCEKKLCLKQITPLQVWKETKRVLESEVPKRSKNPSHSQ